jgi:hypothetical protein
MREIRNVPVNINGITQARVRQTGLSCDASPTGISKAIKTGMRNRKSTLGDNV